MMKGELGIAICGLACCLCSENTTCNGCNSGECSGNDWCENRKCSLEKGIAHCYDCEEDCQKGLLLEQLRGTGFEIQLMEEGGECFAVVDQKIVWYCNMNFLSKEDMEDNLMRVVSGDIAAEIMEMTFGGEKELMDW